MEFSIWVNGNLYWIALDLPQEQTGKRMAPLSGGSIIYFNLLYYVIVHLGAVDFSLHGVFCVLALQCPPVKDLHCKIFIFRVVLSPLRGRARRRSLVHWGHSIEWDPGSEQTPSSCCPLLPGQEVSSFTSLALPPSTGESGRSTWTWTRSSKTTSQCDSPWKLLCPQILVIAIEIWLTQASPLPVTRSRVCDLWDPYKGGCLSTQRQPHMQSFCLVSYLISAPKHFSTL